MVDMLWKLVQVAALSAVSFLGPGFLLVRRMPWTGAERLAAAFGLSVVMIGATTSAIYLASLPPWAHWVVTALAGVALCWSWPELRAVWSEDDARHLVVSYAAICAWALGWIALVRALSGGGWAGDWVEHYDRCQFFLRHWPRDTRFLGTYWLPARPPLMNLASVHVLAMVGPDFPLFQTVTALLNLGCVIPAYLLARRFAGRHALPLLVFTAFFAANPMVIENAVYPWTKLLAAAFVVLGTHFYLTGWERADPLRIRFAAGALGAGILTHYSAAPYAVFFAGHYLWRVSRRFANRMSELVRNAATAAAIVAPWLLWSWVAYGPAITFGGNTSVEGYRRKPWSADATMVLGNLVNTFVPHQLRSVDYAVLGNSEAWSRFRDDFFLLYQTNALFMIGSAGAVALAWTLSRSRDRNVETDRFWAGFAATAILLGLASHGAPDMFGLAHIALEPLALVVLAALAGCWHAWPRALRLVVVAGLTLDSSFGVGLQALIQSRVFGQDNLGEAGFMANTLSPTSFAAESNWVEKIARGFPFLGDIYRPVSREILIALVIAAALAVTALLRDASRERGPR